MVWVRWPKPSPLVSTLVILHLLFTTSPNPSTLAALALPTNVQDNTTPTFQGSSGAMNDLDRDTPPSDWMMDHLASIDSHIQVHIIAPDTSGDNSPLRSLPPLYSLPPIPDTPTYLPQFSDRSTESSFEPFAPPIWHSVNTNQQHRPVFRPLGLRHKPTMDWGMRARARNQIHWDKYWFQLEASRYDGGLMANQEHHSARREQGMEASGQKHNHDESENDNKSTAGDQNNGKHSTSCSPPTRLYSADINNTDNSNNSNDTGRDGIIPNSANGTLNTTKSFAGDGSGGCEGMSTGGSPSISPTTEDDDTGFFYFRQILNHFQEPSSSPGGESEGRSEQGIFRQYYHVSEEFYKPGKEQT